MYAKWNDGIMLVTDTEKAGYKPMVQTEAPEAPSGYYATFYWQETVDSFEQTWEIVPEPEPDAEISDYEQQLADLGVRFE